MAKKYIELDIIQNDRFMFLPLSTRMLYIYMVCESDDEGFINNSTAIARVLGVGKIEFELLCNEGLITPFKKNGFLGYKLETVENFIRKPYIKQDKIQKDEN